MIFDFLTHLDMGKKFHAKIKPTNQKFTLSLSPHFEHGLYTKWAGAYYVGMWEISLVY